MRNLWYAPKAELYVMHYGRGGEGTCYDLSRDVTDVSVRLADDGAGTFSATLQNVGGKYTGLFLPMDVICVYATAQHGRIRLFTGYLNKVTAFTLYPGDYHMSGTDTLYRLQRLYWDPAVEESIREFSGSHSNDSSWKGPGETIARVMSRVAGADPSSVYIQDVPQDMVDWASKIYEDEAESEASMDEGLRSLSSALRTSGLFASSVNGGTTSPGSYGGTAPSGSVEAYVQWMENVANDPSVGYSQVNRCMNPDVDCSSFVYYALLNNGWTDQQMTGGSGYPWTTWTMEERLSSGCGFTRYDFDGDASKLRRGDIFVLDGYGRDGGYHEHTEVYWGDGKTIGAHSDENGGVTGSQSGDQGNEVGIVDMSPSWTQFWRYEGGAS